MYHVNEIIGPLSREQIVGYQCREHARFAAKQYFYIKALSEPDVLNLYNKFRETHWAHVSIKRAPQIAFTPTEFDGVKDRQVSLKLGRYLTRFMPELGEARILELVQQHNAQFDIRATHIAKTPRTISTVYQRGVNSCMAHSHYHYLPDYNPTAVYGAGDIGVFFMWDKSNKRRRITGRVLVHLERKAYGRIYGDDQRMEVALAKAGYHPDEGDEFQDARIIDVKHDGIQVCPYFDNGYQLAKCYETGQLFMTTGSNSSDKYTVSEMWDADQTNGLAEENGMTSCYECGGDVHEDELYYAYDDGYCESCYTDRFTSCESCSDPTEDRNTVEVHRSRPASDGSSAPIHWTEWWCHHCAEGEAVHCSDCHECHQDDSIQHSEHDDEVRCNSCHENHENQIAEQQQSEEEADGTTIEQYAPV